jgi:hypothetical protein
VSEIWREPNGAVNDEARLDVDTTADVDTACDVTARAEVAADAEATAELDGSKTATKPRNPAAVTAVAVAFVRNVRC